MKLFCFSFTNTESETSRLVRIYAFFGVKFCSESGASVKIYLTNVKCDHHNMMTATQSNSYNARKNKGKRNNQAYIAIEVAMKCDNVYGQNDSLRMYMGRNALKYIHCIYLRAFLPIYIIQAS